jgi:ureidoglycolate lyase
MKIKVQRLDNESFTPFGDIIGRPRIKPEISTPEIDVWPGISDIELCSGKGQFYWMDIKVPRPFICDSFEKHKTCGEVLIPIEGQSIAIFGLSKNNIPESEDLDQSTLKAFILDGSLGVNINKGVWHWLPYPLSGSASFAVILEKDTHKDDLLIKDFKVAEGLTIKLEL